MGMLNKDERGRFITVLAEDGTFREKVSSGTQDAVLRKYELQNGTKGEKWELVWNDMRAKIKNIYFKLGDYGQQMYVVFVDDEKNEVIWVQGVASPFAEDFLKKLPNIDLEHTIWLRPYSFLDDEEKKRRGVSVKQGTKKIENFFFDAEKKKNKNGYPEPEGDKKEYDSDDWKMYFTKARKFLIKYAQENICTKFEQSKEAKGFDYPAEDINPEDIPF